MKKIIHHPIALTGIIFLYMELVGYLAGWISYQFTSHVPKISEWIGANYINMLLTEMLSLGALLLFFRNALASLTEKNKKNSPVQKQTKNWKFLWFFLPVVVQIAWDISSLFLEEITLSLLSPTGIVLFLLCFITTMSIALLEETAWRKIVFQSMRQKWGVIQGILVSSFLFGIIHYMNMLSGQTFAATTIQVVQAIGMGMFLAILYYITDNFLLLVFIHGLCNFSNFFCNEMIEWNYAGYWWDAIWQAAFTILYFVVSVIAIKKILSTKSGCSTHKS